MKYYIVLMMALLSLYSNCQDTDPKAEIIKYKNNLQFELGGHAWNYSLIYERIIVNRPKYKTSLQAGASYYKNNPYGYYDRQIYFPISINEFISFNNHHLEFGIGSSFRFQTYKEDGFYIYKDLLGRIGYRYQKPEGRLVFRVAFMPMILLYKDWQSFGGVSWGYCF